MPETENLLLQRAGAAKCLYTCLALTTIISTLTMSEELYKEKLCWIRQRLLGPEEHRKLRDFRDLSPRKELHPHPSEPQTPAGKLQ